MRIQSLLIKKFRNHSNTQIEFSPGINIILGDNGEGKTNILEGISYICLSKSFFALSDSQVIQNGENEFIANGKIISERNIIYEVRVKFNYEQGQRTVTINNGKVEKTSTIFGKFPIVILSPEQSVITLGSPVSRRKFVDFVISQASKAYLENLLEYRRILKQRNKILSESNKSIKDINGVISPWNANLIMVGSEIIRKRYEFALELQGFLRNSYNKIAGIDEKAFMKYEPSFGLKGDEDYTSIEKVFECELNDSIEEDCRVGMTLIGPHRDEFKFCINEFDVRKYASQGQHKTLLVALKLAEFTYLKNTCKETPILFLDDVFCELDKKRSLNLIECISNIGQVFITSTDDQFLKFNHIDEIKPVKYLTKQGKVQRFEDATKNN